MLGTVPSQKSVERRKMAKAKEKDKVKVHYTGKLKNGNILMIVILGWVLQVVRGMKQQE